MLRVTIAGKQALLVTSLTNLLLSYLAYQFVPIQLFLREELKRIQDELQQLMQSQQAGAASNGEQLFTVLDVRPMRLAINRFIYSFAVLEP